MAGMDREERNAAIAGTIGLALVLGVFGVNNFDTSNFGFEDIALVAVGGFGMYIAADELVLRQDSLND